MNETTELDFIAEKLFTISEAAKSIRITRQAVYIAIKMKRLNARKDGSVWLISSKDLKAYMKNRYTRSLSRHDGELIFDKHKGLLSISEASKMLKKNRNRIYYLVRMGRLKSHRLGGNIIIREEDLNQFIEENSKRSGKKIVLC